MSPPPPPHLEDLEDTPVPGLPPPLAVVQGAEGSSEDAQGGLAGGEQGPVLLTCEGTRWLSRLGVSPCCNHHPGPSSTGLQSPARPRGAPGHSRPMGSATHATARESLGPPTPPEDGAEPVLSPPATTYRSPRCSCLRTLALQHLSASLGGGKERRGPVEGNPQHAGGPVSAAGWPLPGSQGPGGASPSPRCRR